MKKQLLTLCLCVAVVQLASAVDVIFRFVDSTRLPQGTKAMDLISLAPPATDSTNLVTVDLVRKKTGTDGSVTYSNLIGGTNILYRAELRGDWGTTTNWFRFPETNALLNAADPQWIATPTNNSAGFAYSIGATDLAIRSAVTAKAAESPSYTFDHAGVVFSVSASGLPLTPFNRRIHSQYGIDTLRAQMQAVTNFTFRAPLADTNSVDTDLITAIRTQGSNNCIVLTNGVYYIGTNAVLMSKGSVLLGQSMSNVVIYGRGPAPDNSSGVLRINDGCTVANLTGSTIPSPASPYNYTKAFEFYGGGYNNEVTNTAYLINTLSFSDTDTIRGGGVVQVINSCVHGKWDGFFLESLCVTNRALIYNCYGFADDTSLNQDILLADSHALRLTGLRVDVWYSDFVATDNVIGNGSVAATVETPCTATFYECSFTPGINGGDVDGDFAVEVGGSATCTISGGAYDPAKISNHGTLVTLPSQQEGSSTNTPNGALVSMVVQRGKVIKATPSFDGGSLSNVTVFSTNVLNRAVHLTNSFNGVVIDATKVAQSFTTNASFAVSGFSGVTAQHLFSMCVSNSSGSAITWTGPANAHYATNGFSTNTMSIPAGQEMIVSFWIRPGRTNYINCLAP